MNEFIASNDPNDLVIKPLKGMRGKRHDLLKNGNVKAVIYLGFTQDGYSHPALSLMVNKPYYEGCEERDDKNMLRIRYLASTQDASKRATFGMYSTEGDHDEVFCKSLSRGFLRGPVSSKLSAPFSGDLECRADNLAYLECGLGLLNRAKEAISADDKEGYANKYRKLLHGKCDLLKLIVGLRLIGVTIVIKNGRTDKIARHSRPWSLTA